MTRRVAGVVGYSDGRALLAWLRGQLALDLASLHLSDAGWRSYAAIRQRCGIDRFETMRASNANDLHACLEHGRRGGLIERRMKRPDSETPWEQAQVRARTSA